VLKPPDQQPAKCIACKEPIDADATVCSKCKSYQAQWKNYLQYGASIVGILTVIGALIVYTISISPDVKRVLFPLYRVEVLSFASHRDVTILNTSNDKIFISHISSRTTQGATHTFPINKVLEAGEVITHPAKKETLERLYTYDVVSNVTMDEWNQKVSIYGMTDDLETCIPFVILFERDPTYQMWKGYFKNGFRTIAATAAIHFFPIGEKQSKEQPIPVYGALLQNPDKNCKLH
jgi:hypothetical protein